MFCSATGRSDFIHRTRPATYSGSPLSGLRTVIKEITNTARTTESAVIPIKTTGLFSFGTRTWRLARIAPSGSTSMYSTPGSPRKLVAGEYWSRTRTMSLTIASAETTSHVSSTSCNRGPYSYWFTAAYSSAAVTCAGNATAASASRAIPGAVSCSCAFTVSGAGSSAADCGFSAVSISSLFSSVIR